MHGPSHHPSRGHPSGSGRATSRDPSSAPQGDPSLLLWENPVFSGCRDKDEEGRGFLEGRAAGTVWGNTRQGLCCDKAPAGAGGFEGLSDKGNWGEPAPAALATPKTSFYPERRLPGLGRAGEQRGFVSPRPSSPLGVPWEVQDAAPPCRAFSSPHPSLAAGSWHRICANPAAGAAVPVLEPSKRQRFHPPPVPWLLAERAFPRCCRPGGGGWGGSVGALPCPCHSRGRHRHTLQPVPVTGEVEWGSHAFGCPEGTGSALAWPCALCFATAPVPPQSWAELGAVAGV